MVEFDPKTITVGELLALYNRVGSAGEEGKGPKNPRGMPAILKQYENMSAYDFFYEDDEVSSQARKTMTEAAKKGNIPKATTQTFRYLSNLLSKGYERNPPTFLARKPDDPAEAERLFGLKEAPKASAKIAVTQDAKKLQNFFEQLAEYEAQNPEQKSVVRAIHFGLNTGLRPSAYVMVPSSNKETEAGSGLFSYQYKDQSGSLFIEGESTGAKTRDISVPLNNTADVKVQEQILFNQENGLIPEVEEGADPPRSRVFLNPDGSPVTSKQVNEVLSKIKVPELIWDAKNRKYYDNFMLDADAKTKKGLQIFRNFHTQYGEKTLGIPLNILAKLQGRSVKSTKMDSATGSLLEYDEDFPGEVSDLEREMANRFTGQNAPLYDAATERAKAINPEYNFDYGDPEKTLIQTRVSRNTEGLGRYFDAPPTETLPAAKPEPKVEVKTIGDIGDKFKALADGLMKTGKFAIGGLGVAGLLTASEEAYTKEMEESGSKVRALGAGAVTGAYEALEPLPIGFIRPQPVGEGSDVVPTDESGEPSYPFIEQYEAEQAQKQSGVPTEDENLMEGIQADIEITYPREEEEQ